MSIAGHVSRAMLSRYSHVRMEAKRRALDEIAARQRAADEKRREDAEQQHPNVPHLPPTNSDSVIPDCDRATAQIAQHTSRNNTLTRTGCIRCSNPPT